ncbi:MAG TPA: helix-turn-helix domain-containing protein [Clostridiales bacterium]|nr:helix-turn-helix domain-containing protein [Clostridiales bacterium]
MQQPYLYTLISQDQLKEMLEAFEACTGIPIQVIDEHGTILESCGKSTNFCSIFQKYLPSNETCDKIHINASKRAISIGETYIFACHANLNHIVFPLLNSGSFWGSILVGPFLMDAPDSLLIHDLDKKYHIPTYSLIEMYEESSNLKVVPPSIVTQISRLLYYLFSNLLNEGKQQLIINQGKLHQQSKINESIQMYKNSGVSSSSSYPYEKEKALLAKVKAGNVQEAKGILNDLLGYVLFSGGSNLDNTKTRAIELCSLLSRTAIEGGAASDSILKINNQFLKSLQQITNLDSLCFKLQETVEVFTESMFNYIPSKNHEMIKKAMLYISNNFSKNITLEDVAAHVHLNPAYFSTIFKQSSRSTFKEYLNMVRVEESKRLLANTDYSIINIAIATGFEDQSYFSKVFKKYTGLTPRQYRG